MKICKFIAAALMCCCAARAAAVCACGDSQPPASPTLKTNALMVGVGCTDLLDTYLSPEKYRGTAITLLSHTRRERDRSVWVRQLRHEGYMAYADNRSGNGGEMSASYTFGYSLMRKWRASVWRLPVQLMAGATAEATAGFVYNTRNGNNPANARLALRVSPTVAADLPIGRASHTRGMALHPGDCAHYPVLLHYEASVSLLGLMFSPNYGQSYYEIFNRGNYDHNCVPTTFGSTPSFRHMLTLDVRALHTTWRMGYLGNLEQARVNGLKQHTYTHSFVIGVVRRFRTYRHDR